MLRTAYSIVVVTLAFLLAASWSPPAQAVVVTGGFNGRIFSGFDFGSGPGGYFGVGSDLDDQLVSGTFRYDTAKVPPPSSSGPNSAIYSDPTFATDFLAFTVAINGHSYAFGTFPAAPGIQSIDIIDNTDQLQFDYQRFAVGAAESIALRFISDLEFLAGITVPTRFDFVASGVGLTPGGSFSFDLPNGDSAFAQFSIEQGFARTVPAPATLSTMALGLLAIVALRRRRRGSDLAYPADPPQWDPAR